MRIRVLVALLACLAIAGCSSSGSSGSTSTAAAPAGPLGDVTTLDPCSLIDAAKLPADLHAAPAEQKSLDSCYFTVIASGRGALLVAGRLVSSLPNTVTGPGQPLGHGFAIHDGTEFDNACTSAVELGTGGYLLASADLNLGTIAHPGTSVESLCQAAHNGAVDVADVLIGGAPMRHRQANSVDRLTACALADGLTIDGTTLPHLIDDPAGHSCEWFPPDPTAAARQLPDFRLDFTIDTPSSQQMTIAGRSSTRSGSTGPYDRTISICYLETVLAPYSGHADEVARIIVTDQGGQEDHTCLLSTDLANLIWPKLPPAAK